MVKSTKKKFLSFLNLLILFALFCCLSGCGNSETTDTGTTPTGTGRQIALSGSPTSLAEGQNSILTATVTDSSGSPVSSQTVTFTLSSINSSNPLINGKTTATATTDAAGRALVIYTAGANTTTASVQDTIEAGTGTIAKGYVIMTVTPNTGVTSGGYQMALTANPTSLASGQNSILSATVTDGSGKPVSDETVTFTLSSKNSSSPLMNGKTTTTATATTDAAGRASVVYTAGTNSTSSSIQDTIEASVGITVKEYAIITVTPNSAVTSVGHQMALTANVTSIAAGQSSIITATLTDGSNMPVSGQPVSFILSSKNSVSPSLTPTVVYTDAAGRASTVYTAGANSTTASVQDIVNASIGTTATGYIIMTVTAGSSTSTGVRLTVEATPISLVAGAMSVIVAQVNNADGTAASGQTVTFGFVTNNSLATLADMSGSTTVPVTGITDANGIAVAVYTAGNSSPSLSMQDTISASVTGSAGAVIITRLPAVGTGNRIITFTEDPETSISAPLTPPWVNVIMKVKVTTDDLTSPVVNETVTFSIIVGTGTLNNPTLGTSGSPITATTDTNGEAWVLFTRPPTGTGDTVVRAQIPGTTNGGDASRIVYWTDVVPTVTP